MSSGQILVPDNLNHIAFFFNFSRARYNKLSVITPIGDNFLCEPRKINFEFHRNCENTGKVSCVRFQFMNFDGTLSKYFLKYNNCYDFELNFPLFGLSSYIPFFNWKIYSKPRIIEPEIHVPHSKVKP